MDGIATQASKRGPHSANKKWLAAVWQLFISYIKADSQPQPR